MGMSHADSMLGKRNRTQMRTHCVICEQEILEQAKLAGVGWRGGGQWGDEVSCVSRATVRYMGTQTHEHRPLRSAHSTVHKLYVSDQEAPPLTSREGSTLTLPALLREELLDRTSSEDRKQCPSGDRSLGGLVRLPQGETRTLMCRCGRALSRHDSEKSKLQKGVWSLCC